MKIKQFRKMILASVFILIMLVGCASNTGIIEGTIKSESTGEMLADVHIILCLEPSTEEEYLCTLQAKPTTTSDSNGVFRLSNVPEGSYLLMYAMPDELSSTSKEWNGVELSPTILRLDGFGNFVPHGEGLFWEDGWEIDGNIATGSGLSLLIDGYIISNRLGISIMIQDQKKTPFVEVNVDEQIQYDWILMGR